MKILIADDHALVREGLKTVLQQFAPDTRVLEAGDGAELLHQLAAHTPVDIALLDLYMPGGDGFDLVGRVCDRYPAMPVIVLSASDRPADMRKALDRGASGFIPKSTSQDVMLSAIKLVLSGGVYIPPDLLKGDSEVREQFAPLGPNQPLPDGSLNHLTERQRQVLGLLAKGKQNKLIARELGLSEHTVKIHVTAILKALGVANRTQAVLAAQRLGL